MSSQAHFTSKDSFISEETRKQVRDNLEAHGPLCLKFFSSILKKRKKIQAMLKKSKQTSKIDVSSSSSTFPKFKRSTGESYNFSKPGRLSCTFKLFANRGIFEALGGEENCFDAMKRISKNVEKTRPKKFNGI